MVRPFGNAGMQIGNAGMQSFFRRHKRAFYWTGGLLLGALALTSIYAPFIIKHYLNHKVFRDVGQYTGRVDDVDVNLLRGSYVLRDLVLWRKGGNREVPFVDVEALSISVSWEALVHGSILASVTVDKGELNFLDARRPEERQTGKGANWLEVLERVLPTTLHRLEITRSRLTFQNFDTEPKVNLSAENIEAVVTNLTNVKDEEGRRVADARVSANLLDGASLKAEAKFDPFDFNDFIFAGEMHDVHLPQINNFTTNYANIDFEDGRGELFVELKAVEGKLTGYIKPLFEDINIMSWRQDVEKQKDNPFQLLWEGALGFFKTLFTNMNTKQFATQIDIEGSLDQANVDTWQAVVGLVKNAFVRALEARFENLTTLTQPDDKARGEKDGEQESVQTGDRKDKEPRQRDTGKAAH